MSPTPFKKKQVSIRDINKEIAKEYKSEREKYHKEESDWALSTADEMNEAIKSTPEYKIGKNVGKWMSKYKDGEPTTADEHNEKWLNEKEGKS